MFVDEECAIPRGYSTHQTTVAVGWLALDIIWIRPHGLWWKSPTNPEKKSIVIIAAVSMSAGSGRQFPIRKEHLATTTVSP